MTVHKAMPILWRYLVVVLISCGLAFIISRKAQAESSTKSVSVTKYAIETTEESWLDEARKRRVPVRIISPKIADVSDAVLFPVILFSHGLGGSREGGKTWGEHWAAHGYIVIHMQHLGSDESVWKGKRVAEFASEMRRAMTMSNLGLRIGDVHFVIDEVLMRKKARNEMFSRADTSRIGVAGHSFGAQTVMSVAGQVSPAVAGQSGVDKRVTAALALSPNARNKQNLPKQYGSISMPLMSITGTLDGAVLDDGTEPQHRTLPYENMPAGNKYLLVLAGGDHSVFGGHNLRGMRDMVRDSAITQHVKSVTLAYWNAHLKADAKELNWLRAKDGFAAKLSAADRYEFK
jgi:dienelactone hydrolase